MCSVQNLTLLCNNLSIFGQKTSSINLKYMLKPFLAIFEKFKCLTTATLTPKRNTVPPHVSVFYTYPSAIFPQFLTPIPLKSAHVLYGCPLAGLNVSE